MFTGLRRFLSNGIRFFLTTGSANYVGIRGPRTEPGASFYLTLPSTLPGSEQALTIDANGNLSTAALGSGGSVSSVALAAPAIFSVDGSPITTSGTLTLALVNQNANTFFMGPSGGGAAAPTFRAIAYADVSSLVGQSANTLAAGNDARFHTQGTDTGTTNGTFALDSDGTAVLLKANAGSLEIRNAGDTGFANLEVGDLTVRGTTTTVNSETVTIADNILTLNSDVTGTPTQNAGIEIERGDSTNASLIWDESGDRWAAGLAGSEVAIARVYQTTFTNASLTAGVLTVTHNLGNQYPGVWIIDNGARVVLPDEVTFTNGNSLTVDLTSFGTLTGTWRVTVVG